MNRWMPIVVAAVIVGAIGVGVGLVARGGGDSTVTTTVTEASPTSPTSTSSSTDTDATTTAPAEGPDGATALTDAYSEEELSAAKGDVLSQCVEPNSAGARGLSGSALVAPAVFGLNYSDRTYCGPWRVTLPVGDYETLQIGELGWADNVPAGATAEFAILPETVGSEPIYEGSFTGPGDLDSGISLEIAGNEQLVFEWKLGAPLSETDDNVFYRFILDQAYVS